MADRLSVRELGFLTGESLSVPRHNATLEILDPGDSGLDYERFCELVADRLAFVPRYRQRVHSVPGRLAGPVWADDDRFDLEYHVRRSALPRPGTLDQLRDLAARIISRPLDRSRPLWEMYFVEGLADGRVAVLSKAHQALVDGVETVDLEQILLDVNPDAGVVGTDSWRPRTLSSTALVFEAVRASFRPETALGVGNRLAVAATRWLHLVTTAAETLTGRRSEHASPLAGELSQQRLVVALDTSLDDYRRIRDAHGGTINDVILAVVTGGLRGWLMTRAERLSALRALPVLVPVSVIDEGLEATLLGSQIAPHHVQLPLDEVSPVVRLHQVSYSFDSHQETGRAVAANRLAGITGFAPTTFHAMGSRVAAAEVGRGFALSVTNVPGPQTPRYAAGARLVASYPIPPLPAAHALAIGVTSYQGKVFFGLTADRDLIPDADVLGQCLLEALDELLDTSNGERRQAPRGRRR